MTNSRHTIIFAAFVFVGYCVGYSIAARVFPTALWMEFFPGWMMALGFAFITTPVAWIHSTVVGYVARKRTHRSAGYSLLLSTFVILPVVVGLTWLGMANLAGSYPDIENMIAPPDAAFQSHNAVMTIVLRNCVPLMLAAWGSTLLLLKSISRSYCPTDACPA